MPIYEYRCGNGHNFEVIQKMSDAPVAACEVCGEPVERVFHPIAVHFKGSGFYSTDYGSKGKKGAAADSGSGESSSGSEGSGTESKGTDPGSASDSPQSKPKASAAGE